MNKLEVGQKAPAFSGKNQDGKVISLDDFKGQKVVLYFYPKDNTPGCTAEACNLNDNLDQFAEKGFKIIGVSPDSEASHQKFRDKYGLKFDLIADTEKEILEKYGVWAEKKMYGRTYMGVVRTTFVIDEDGLILKIFEKVKTKEHAEQIFEDLKF
ncbi:thioredoxin-dependent thiol peroxidase [Thermophagus sp. OGC60D27]|uniref:thioredoxin-dependent thiol peroxidase n=1 Tax=Thermophagus sp. OGC60D27 TaxID=3458415 RepID=UPI0040380F0A